MRYLIKTDKGFTLVELLVTVVIIGILASVSVPAYTRYITSARSAEAPTHITAIRDYVLGYIRSHPDTMFASRSLLNPAVEACSPSAERASCNETMSDDWLDQVVGNDHPYFNYYWTGGTTRRIEAEAGRNLCSDCSGNKIFYTFNANGMGGHWSVSPASSKMLDIVPD